MAIKLRLGEKEILEKAVRTAAASREHFRRQMEAAAPLPKYEESGLGLLEAGGVDSRLPLGLRTLDGEAGVAEALALTAAAEQRLVNGESALPYGTRPEQRAGGAAKDASSDSPGGLQG